MVDLIWATGRDATKDWEYSWIRELLQDVPVTLHPLGKVIPNALIVVNHDINYLSYLTYYEQNNIPFSLIHLSEEYKTDNITPYIFKNCQQVFRNYYRADTVPRAIHFPLGYKLDFWKEGNPIIGKERTASERKWVWSFAGGMRPNHKETIALFQQLDPHQLVIETGNSFNNVVSGLDTVSYRNLMLDSIFVLCPEGNASVDCFRVYEALECGCIPIVFSKNTFQWFEEGSYWKHIMQSETEPPFVMALTMEENVKRVQELLLDKEALEKQRLACWEAWQQCKTRLREMFRSRFSPKVPLAAYYQCYKQPKAFAAVLEAFHNHHPTAPMTILSDNGNDYSAIAKHYGYTYIHSTTRAAQDNGLIFHNSATMLEFIKRFVTQVQKMDADWVLLLEDDVLVLKPIDTTTLHYTLNGINPNEYLPDALAHYLGIEGKQCYGGCGGSIISVPFIKRLVLEEVLEECERLCTVLEGKGASDILLTAIVLRYGGTLGPYEGFAETWYPDIKERLAKQQVSVLHQYKNLYC
jgi:hypothetical protein